MWNGNLEDDVFIDRVGATSPETIYIWWFPTGNISIWHYCCDKILKAAYTCTSMSSRRTKSVTNNYQFSYTLPNAGHSSMCTLSEHVCVTQNGKPHTF